MHDDGKGFVGVHSATITFTDWPEYGEMIGGYFDEHPWGTFDAPIIVEDPNFPGMQQWSKSFMLRDEIYQVKDFSRDKVRVLMRLDASKLDLNNPRVHRKDHDFAVTWAKQYGKGRVYYSTLGHVDQNWDDPRMQKMYMEAIKWAMGLVDADVTPRPLPDQSGSAALVGAARRGTMSVELNLAVDSAFGLRIAGVEVERNVARNFIFPADIPCLGTNGASDPGARDLRRRILRCRAWTERHTA